MRRVHETQVVVQGVRGMQAGVRIQFHNNLSLHEGLGAISNQYETEQ